MRANRLAPASAIGFLAAGVAWTTVAISDDAPSTSPPHPHEAVACVTCHLGRGGDATAAKQDVCVACHQEASPTSALLGAWGPSGAGASSATSLPVAAVSSDCARCHSFHAPTTIALGERVADLARAHVADHCGACHDHADPGRLGRLTEGHVAAAALYHWIGPELASLTTSEACLICHDRDGNLPTDLPVFLPVTPRFETHASHPFGVRMNGSGEFFRSAVDPRIPLFDGNIECLTCHDLGAQNEDLVIAFETKYEMCRGCHTQGLPRNPATEALVEN